MYTIENNQKPQEEYGRIKAICTVEKIIYEKDDFTIAVVHIVEVKSGKVKIDRIGNITIKGTMASLNIGGTYNLVADYKKDPKWGEQYQVIKIYNAITFEKDDKTRQKKFLASLFTPNQIEAIYEALDDPYEVFINNDIEKLVTVKGCGFYNATLWLNRFQENLHIGKIFSELEEYDLTIGMIKKLMNKYDSPELVISKVKDNPYILCTEVDGIGWKTADKIAIAGGMQEHDTKRVCAFIIHYLSEVGESGHSWITTDELMGALLDNLGEELPDEVIRESIYDVQEQLWWSKEKDRIGLLKYHIYEMKVAKELIRIRDAESKIKQGDWEDAIKHIEHQNGWFFTDEQKLGVKTALENNVVVIHGEAGTGKSTSVSALLEALRGHSYAQCALSGRASSRMAEITGVEGYTIHRLLGFPCQDETAKNRFEYHDENPLTQEIIIVDEISMIDIRLFYYLVRAIPSGSKLIMLGDMGQLESIGAGNIAFDMIQSKEIPTVYLSQIHRQAAASAIITEARKIRQSKQIIDKEWVGKETRGELQDLSLDCYSDMSNTFYKIMEKFSAKMNEPNFDIMETQILVPLKNRGDACTFNINNTIQELYNPAADNKQEIVLYKKGMPMIIREGDKIINTQNNYKTSPPVFNGNIGVVTAINLQKNEITVSFVNLGSVTLDSTGFQGLELGYAITIHKSQGSQFDNVILGIDFSGYALLTRELLYTGITRAKKKCEIVAQTGALRFATATEGVSTKQTHLQECLDEAAHPKLEF